MRLRRFSVKTLEAMMAAGFMLVIDCADPGRLSRFWAAALGYVTEAPPVGWPSWDDYWRSIGVARGGPRPSATTASSTRTAAGPASGSRWCPSARRRHRTGCTATSTASAGRDLVTPGRRSRSRPAGSASTPRPSRLAALGRHPASAPSSTEGLDHYGVAMRDPEGNEFDIN